MKIESLEARRLFDVTVTEGYPGFYEIHGTDDADVIEAFINMSEESLTVNGTRYESASYVVAYGYGGNDTIIITPLDGLGMIGASVAAGDGHDMVSLAVDGAVWAGHGNDEIYLLDSFRGEAYGEAGNDSMHISGLTTDAEIRGGDGHDLIDCSSNQYGVVVFGGTGNDTIIGSEFGDQLYGEAGHDVLEGRGGNDTFYARGGDSDTIDGGAGDDIAYLDYDQDAAGDVEYFYFMFT
jgi:Ca2+-binding RTX toxin-like protein